MLRRLPLFLAFALALTVVVPTGGAEATSTPPPQQDWMVHMAVTNGSWSYVPDRIVLLPGGLVQLMVFGDGQFSLTLDHAPDADADIASTKGTVRVAELRAPMAPGDYAFHDKYHPEARGVLVVAQAAPAAASPSGAADAPVIGVVPAGYESDFAPARIEVAPGAEVLFRANGTFGHNLRAVDGAFDAGDLPPGGETSFRAPEQAGEYAFECRFHADLGMRGTLVVRERPPEGGGASVPAESSEDATRGADGATAPRETPVTTALVLGALLLVALALRRGASRWPPR